MNLADRAFTYINLRVQCLTCVKFYWISYVRADYRDSLINESHPVLKYISDRHIVHGNIKPENIICTQTGDFVLVNFATAKLVPEFDFFTDESSIGSAEYAAPEQTKGKCVFATDLYSLGVTCIFLLTQITPFDLFDVANNCWAWRDYLTTKVSDKLLENPRQVARKCCKPSLSISR